MLDYLSRETDHQIVLISAAMGNAGAIAQWLSPDGQALRHESQWHGPRRLHAAFTTEAHWDETRVEQSRTRHGYWPYRLITPLSGLIRLRMANGHTTSYRRPRPIGAWSVRPRRRTWAVRTAPRRGPVYEAVRHRQRDDLQARARRIVLVVAGTRDQAQQLAQGLAADARRRARPGAAG